MTIRARKAKLTSQLLRDAEELSSMLAYNQLLEFGGTIKFS